MLNKLGEIILDGIQVIGISAIIIVIANVFIARPQEVEGMSMHPYLKDGDHLMTEKISYRFREPKRGEVIVFKYPLDAKKEYIKRVIALPDEKVQIKNNQIIVYNSSNPEGFILEEDYLDEEIITQGKVFLKEGEVKEVGSNEYVVFGDNRPQSSDSRQWGYITQEDIVGRAYIRYWPPQSFGVLD